VGDAGAPGIPSYGVKGKRKMILEENVHLNFSMF